MRWSARARCLAVCIAVSAACGPGTRSSADAGTDVPVQPEVTISIDPPSATVDSGATLLFSATVTGSADRSVVWSAEAGSIDQSGRYTAPASGGDVRVTVTSRANPAASATARVSVRPVSITVAPRQIELAHRARNQFTAIVTGAVDSRVTWTVLEPAGGTIDPAGTYTAPDTPGTFHVVATSVADPASTAAATVTVKQSPGAAVSIVPSDMTVRPGRAVLFMALVTGATDSRVVWTCDKGRIRQDGLYFSPQAEGVYHVTAQSLADPSKVDVASVRVVRGTDTAPPVEPDQVTVEVTGLVVFHANLPDTADTDVVWSILEGDAGGTIDALGQYIAPADHEGVYHVVATSRTDPTKTGTAIVTVERFDLVDHGGNVAPSTRTFALWWGKRDAFPADARTVIESLLSGLDGSDYLAIANQYLRGANATTSFGGSLFDSSAPPAQNPTESAIADKACSGLAANGITNQPGDMVFVISSVFPAGNIPYCAWHYWGVCNGQTLLIVYLPNPAGTACGRVGSGGCNAFSAEATAMGTYAAHELMESLTDPYVTGWRDLLGQEIGDKCFGLAACVPLSTGTLQLQPLYSNSTHSCVQR